jgi:hypothetical protein
VINCNLPLTQSPKLTKSENVYACQAIDCCVLLNQWDSAISLAEEHDFPQIDGLLTKYAGHLLEVSPLLFSRALALFMG